MPYAAKAPHSDFKSLFAVHALAASGSLPYLCALQQAMHRLDEEEESLEACSKDDQDPLTGLSQSIREYCTPKELETLDMVTNLAQMARLYREYESEGGAKHDDNTI